MRRVNWRAGQLSLLIGVDEMNNVFQFLACVALLGPASASAQPATDDVTPKLVFAFEENVTLAADIGVGNTPLGTRNIVPITGGRFAGPGLSGTIIPGGWDWQLRRADGCLQIEANYMLRTDDGVVINVINKGRSARRDLMEKWRQCEPCRSLKRRWANMNGWAKPPLSERLSRCAAVRFRRSTFASSRCSDDGADHITPVDHGRRMVRLALGHGGGGATGFGRAGAGPGFALAGFFRPLPGSERGS
jgi:hypothetical protein